MFVEKVSVYTKPKDEQKKKNRASMTHPLKILVTGDVVDGHTFYGPFNTANNAIEFADQHLGDETWLVADIHDEDSNESN